MCEVSNLASEGFIGSRIANPDSKIGIKPLGALSLTKVVSRIATAQ